MAEDIVTYNGKRGLMATDELIANKYTKRTRSHRSRITQDDNELRDDHASTCGSDLSSNRTVDSGVHIEGKYYCNFPHCQQTGKPFNTSSALKKHEATHAPYKERPYQCSHEDCTHRARFPKDLWRHEEIHVDPACRPRYTFPVCHKQLFRADNFARHLSAVHQTRLPSEQVPIPIIAIEHLPLRTGTEYTLHKGHVDQMAPIPRQRPEIASLIDLRAISMHDNLLTDSINTTKYEERLLGHTQWLKRSVDGTTVTDKHAINLHGSSPSVERNNRAPEHDHRHESHGSHSSDDRLSDGLDEEERDCHCAPQECHADAAGNTNMPRRPASRTQLATSLASGSRGTQGQSSGSLRDSKHGTAERSGAADDDADGVGGGDGDNNDDPDLLESGAQGLRWRCPYAAKCPLIARGFACHSCCCCLWNGTKKFCHLKTHLETSHANHGFLKRPDRIHPESEFFDQQTGQRRRPHNLAISLAVFQAAMRPGDAPRSVIERWYLAWHLIFDELPRTDRPYPYIDYTLPGRAYQRFRELETVELLNAVTSLPEHNVALQFNAQQPVVAEKPAPEHRYPELEADFPIPWHVYHAGADPLEPQLGVNLPSLGHGPNHRTSTAQLQYHRSDLGADPFLKGHPRTSATMASHGGSNDFSSDNLPMYRQHASHQETLFNPNDPNQPMWEPGLDAVSAQSTVGDTPVPSSSAPLFELAEIEMLDYGWPDPIEDLARERGADESSD